MHINKSERSLYANEHKFARFITDDDYIHASPCPEPHSKARKYWLIKFVNYIRVYLPSRVIKF